MSVIVYDIFQSALTVDFIEEGVTAKSIIVNPSVDLPFYRKKNKGLFYLDRLEIDFYDDDGKTIIKTVSVNAEQAKELADAAQNTADQAKNLADGAMANAVQNTLAISGLTTVTARQKVEIERALAMANSAETVAVDAISRAAVNEESINLVTEQSDDNFRKIETLQTQYGEIKTLSESNDERLSVVEPKVTENESAISQMDENLESLTDLVGKNEEDITEIKETFVKEGTSTFLESLAVPNLTSTTDMKLSVLDKEVLGLYATHGSFAKVGFVTGNMVPRIERNDGHFVTWGELKKELPKAAADEVTEDEVKLSIYHGWTSMDDSSITEQEILNGTLTDQIHGDEHIHNAPESFDHILEASFLGSRGDGLNLLDADQAKKTFIAFPVGKVNPPINGLSVHGQSALWKSKNINVNGEDYKVLVSDYENISPKYALQLTRG